MTKEIRPIVAIIAVIVSCVVILFSFNAHVSTYQKSTRAYVYGAYKNGAITEQECASLLRLASSCHAYPEVRLRQAKYVRRMVDEAYYHQKCL